MKFTNFLLKLKQKFNNFENSNIDVGDIVWAKTYRNKDELNGISRGHREGQYVIIGKNKNNYQVLFCNSQHKKFKIKYKLSKDNYNMDRDYYVYLGKIDTISKKRIIRKLNFLNDYDLKKIYKLMYIYNKKYSLNLDLTNIDIKINYDKGDVVKDGQQLFYLYNKDQNYLYGYLLHCINYNQNGIYIDDNKYMMSVHNSKKFVIDSSIELIDTAREEDYKKIQKYIEREMSISNQKKVVSVGKIIKYKNKYYYIYDEHRDDLLLYKLYILNEDGDKIKLSFNNETYYTYFEKEKINKYKKIQIINSATDQEIQEIIKQKGKYIISEKDVRNKSNIKHKEFVESKIIMDNNTMNKFVIVKRSGNKIIFVSLTNHAYYSHDFSVSNYFNYTVIEDMDKYNFHNFSKEMVLKK